MTERFPMIDNMRRYGGHFLSKLGDAMAAADPENFEKLCKIFPDEVKKYSNFLPN